MSGPSPWNRSIQVLILFFFRSELYTGTNSAKQNVLSWVAAETTEAFTGDIYPLITDLYTLTGDIYPSNSDYMGIFQFGTEAFSSDKNVTFSVPKLSIDIQK